MVALQGVISPSLRLKLAPLAKCWWVYSLKQTYPIQMMVSNRNPLFQGSIFRGYVSFREGRFGMFCFQMIFSDYQNPRVSTGFNFRPAKIVDQKEADQSGKQSKRIAFQSHPFSGASMLVSGNVFTEWMFQKNDAFKNAFSA